MMVTLAALEFIDRLVGRWLFALQFADIEAPLTDVPFKLRT
jgi:hypothetical protein